MIFGMITALFAFLADQLSKYYVAEHLLENKMGVMYTSFFNMVRAWNTGVSFSLLDNYGEIGKILLIIFALVIVGMLCFWLYKEQDRVIQCALGLIIGGAIGNVVDRVRFGAVFDFLDFHWQDKHWPAFNLADSFICIGAVLIIIMSLINRKKEKKS